MDSIHFVEIFTSIALLLAASFAFDLANAGNRTHPGRRVAVGVLVGLLGCALMFSGWSVTTGAKLDARSVLLSLTGLYFGFLPSLVAALIVGAVRIEMGGAGVATGLLVIAVATASGLAVRRWRAPEVVAYRWPELLGFGVLVHALALGCVVAMPEPGVAPTFSLALVPALAIAPVLTMALGLVLNYRLKQQRAATALARSEERFALVLRGSNDAPWDWDRVADRFYYSPRWWEILGYRNGELPSDPMLWHRLLHPDDVARVDANLESALASGQETFEVEYRLRHRDGHYVPLLGRAVILRDSAGRAVRIAGVTSDLTERNRVAGALAASEDRFRRMLAASPDLVCTTDLAGRITYAPATSGTGFGLRADDEIVGRDFVDLLASKDRDAARARFATLARGERVGPAEYTFDAGHGAALPVEVNADVLKSADGTAEGFFVIVRDLTLRRETELALRLSEARLRGVTENAPDIIVELDPAGRIVYINRVLAGYRQDEVLGRDFVDWAPPEFHPVMRSALRRVFVEREAAAYEAKGAGQDGEWRWYSSRLSPVIVGDEVKSAILVTRDITRRHAADDALRARERTYRAVLATARDGFWMLDLQGRLQDVNEAYVRMSGYSRDELLALSVSDLAVGQGPAEVAARMRECIERGGLRFEARHRRRDGREFAAEVNASFSPDDGGRVFAFIRDIGERKRAEAIVRARFDLAALVPQGSAESLVRLGVDAAARVTGSSCAGFEFVDEAPREGTPRAVTLAAAVCRRERRPIVRNDGTAALLAVAQVAGAAGTVHARELAVPLWRGDAMVAVLDLAGKADPYDDGDVAAAREVGAMLVDAILKKRDDDRLRQAAAVIENTREGVMVTDEAQRILMVNRAFCELTGYTEAEALGRTPALLKSGRHDREFYDEMWRSVRANGHWQGEIWNRRRNGEVYPELLSISTLAGGDGRVANYVGVFADISRLKASEAQLEYLAHHDALTGLPNRLLMMHQVKHAIEKSRRSGRLGALLMLDLDRFKDVNDTFGHLAGDELLQQVSERLTRRLRGADTLTRLGGDEFTVLLEELAAPNDAARVARDIVALLNEPFRLAGGADVRIGASVGISLFPEHADNAETLLQQADTALYRAKDDGRGRFMFYSDDQTYAARERIEIEAKLRRALERRELRVFYQPLVDIGSDRIVGAEALLRWQDPEAGLIAPARFIPVAEETGLIVAIGDWMLREVCQQGRRWIDAGLPFLVLSVNLSPLQFRHGDMGASIASALAETGFPAERLELELTESALMEREDDAVEMLIRLRAQGVRLAIDDFGTGYSSLAHLKRFPIDVLKIDRSFVEDIPEGEDDREIAATVIAMGHTLGLKVLAEGVETDAQLAFLRERGCDLYQGYLKSPAVPAEEFEVLV